MKKIYSILLTAVALLVFAPATSAQKTKAGEEEDWSISGQIVDTGTNPKVLEFPDDDGGYDIKKKVAYSKNISKPFSDGTYWIKLETFATGVATVTSESKPSDIILVLDYSRSMDDSYGEGEETYTPRSVQGYSTQSYGNNNYYYYSESDDRYYAVTIGGNTNPGPGEPAPVRYLTFVDKNGKRWYLNNYAGYNGRANLNNTYYTDGDGLMEDEPTLENTNGPQSNNLGVWRGVLYTRSVQTNSRLDALKSACQAFLTTIHDNDAASRSVDATYAGDRVAVVSFNSNATTHYGLSQINTNYTTMYNYFGGNINTAYYTNPGSALAEAMKQWQDDDGYPTTDETRTRAVVVFTDGCPSSHTSYTFDCDYAESAVNNSNTLKEDYGAVVYTIGLFDTSDHTNWDPIGQSIIDYMNFMSSNFTGVSASSTMPQGGGSSNVSTVNGTITYTIPNYDPWTNARSADAYADADEALAGDSDYFFMASDDPSSLEAIFTKVAQQTAGTAAGLSAATSNVDIISNSFVLPDDVLEADEEDIEDYIKVFTAKLTSMSVDAENNYTYTFETEYLKGHSPYYSYNDKGELTATKVDASIDIDLEGDNGISVTGFDYSTNWCGPVYETNYTPTNNPSQDIAHIASYRGYKIIIMIPIKMNEDAVGGPNVATNGKGSGIFTPDTTTPFIEFDSPTVSLPVNVFIKKIGLKPGESAKFAIERAVIPYDAEGEWSISDIDEDDWHYVSTVFVTRDENAGDDAAEDRKNPTVKVRGLPANITNTSGVNVDVVYRISEEPWGWSYDLDSSSENPQYTVTSKVDNPFEFKNDKKDNIQYKVRHAESKATNSFVGNGSVKYDDSKNSSNRKTFTETETETE